MPNSSPVADTSARAHEPLVRAPSGLGTKRLRTRAKLLNTAASVFAEKGIRSATVVDITKLAQVSNGTFYSHFHNLDDLIANVGEILVTTVHDRLHAQIDGIDEPRVKVAVAVQWLLGLAAANPDVGSLVAQVLSAESPFLDETLARMRHDIARGCDEHVFMVEDVPRLSRLLNAVAVSAIRMVLDGDDLITVQLRASDTQLRMLGVAPEAAERTAITARAALADLRP